MEHGFWKHGSATGQVDSVLKDYEAVSAMLCAMFKFVRDTSQKKQVDVAPADLRKWIVLAEAIAGLDWRRAVPAGAGSISEDLRG